VGLFELTLDEGRVPRGALRWTPYCIAGLLDEHFPFLWKTANAMAVARSNSGEIWEFFVALAIVLHRLAESAHVYLAAAGAGSRVDRVVRCDQVSRPLCGCACSSAA
jgi:hypothetical protein